MTCSHCGHQGNPSDPVNVTVEDPEGNPAVVCADFAGCDERYERRWKAGEVALDVAKEGAAL